MFEKVNKAYEFLCTKSAKIVDGPDPENIILILKTQSILFNRHKEGKTTVIFKFSFIFQVILLYYLFQQCILVELEFLLQKTLGIF